VAYSYVKNYDKFVLFVHDNIALRVTKEQVTELRDLCDNILLCEHRTAYPHAWDAALELCDNKFHFAIEWMTEKHPDLGISPMAACEQGREQEIVDMVDAIVWKKVQ
jgi:hypothetical protein